MDGRTSWDKRLASHRWLIRLGRWCLLRRVSIRGLRRLGISTRRECDCLSIVMRMLTRCRTPIHTVLLSLAVLVIFGIICTLSTKKLHQIILWFAPINILATIGICIALLVCTPDKRSASFVFTHFTDGSGWGNKGWSFLLGFLNVAWVMTDYDATTICLRRPTMLLLEGRTLSLMRSS